MRTHPPPPKLGVPPDCLACPPKALMRRITVKRVSKCEGRKQLDALKQFWQPLQFFDLIDITNRSFPTSISTTIEPE